MVYKDKIGVEPTSSNKQAFETVELETSENKVARGIITDSEIKDEEQEAESGSESKPEIELDVEPNLESGLESISGSVTPEPTLRISKRVMNALNRLTMSLSTIYF